MKVLLISPLSKKITGGIVKWTEHIIKFHNDNPQNIELQLLNNEDPISIVGGAKSIIHRIYSGLRNYYPILKSFKQIVDKEYFDLVHISTSASLALIKDLLIVNIAHKKGIRTVVHFHFGRIPQILKLKNWENYLLTKLLKKIDCAVVMDMASYNALSEYGYKNMCYLPNPLSQSVQNIIDKKNTISRVPRKLVFAGHVVPTKGVFELVEACSKIDNIQLEILGAVNEEIKSSLEKIAGENNQEWLNITGNVSFEQVIEGMLSCDIFVLPTYTEGFPNVILESMACGCSIVTTPVGAIPEMLDINSNEPCGICVPPRNVEKLQEAIEYLLDNNDIAKRMGNLAKERVNNMYAIDKVWLQLCEIWTNTTVI